MLMVQPNAGRIIFGGRDLLECSAREAIAIIRGKVRMIFQDPFSSLNPRKTVRSAIGVPLRMQGRQTRDAREREIVSLLKLTGLDEATRFKYPHELSGGQRQRVVIARALAANPELLIADEPVSKLDLSIKAQIINLFTDLREQMGLTIIFIAHDLRMAKHISHTIAVMYHGRIMEVARARTLFQAAMHPYTIALLDAIPSLQPGGRKCGPPKELGGQDVRGFSPPTGCRYVNACPVAKAGCEETSVDLRLVGDDHWVACRLCG
jgi:oligopeptide/dipeptide ABC transporter ATP-binding protein